MAKILLVEDDELVRETMRNQLEHAGHAVTIARHGGEGLKAIVADKFNLIISDILMPEVEGIEFIMAVRREGLKVPIIAITGGLPRAGGGRNIDYLDLSAKLGASAIIRKPFTGKQLLQLVTECLERGPTPPSPTQP